MQPEELAVDVEALRGVGQTVGKTAAALQAAVTAAGSGLAPPQTPNSAAGVAAEKAEALWVSTLQRLVGQTEEYGESLTSAAQGYQATDQENATALTGTGAGAGR